MTMVRKLIAAVLLLASFACASDAGTPTTTSKERPRSTAKLSVLEPKTGAELATRSVDVKLKLDGGEITKVVSTDLKPNVGHIHVRLDGRTITLLGSLTQPVAVTPGAHVIEAEFVAADHGPFNPRVIAAVTFTVK